MRHRALLLVLATGCGGPAPAATATKAPPKCAEYLDAALELRPKTDALLTWMVMEGAPGYEYEFLLQIDSASTLSFVDTVSSGAASGHLIRKHRPATESQRALAEQQTSPAGLRRLPPTRAVPTRRPVARAALRATM